MIPDLDLYLTIHNEFSYNNTNDPLITNINFMNRHFPTSKYIYVNNTSFNTNNLSIIHFNARILIKNFDDIKYYLLSSNSKYDVIIISETWFKINNKDLNKLNGYKVAYTIINFKMGGGVSIYIRDLFHLEIIKNYSKSIDSICDILTVKISNKSLNNKVFIISGIYRSPTYYIVLFNYFLYTFLNSISNNNDTFICGDFNIDILNKNKLLLIDNFIDLFYQFISFFLL